MSRSGYSDDYEDQRQAIMWRGAVRSAILGKRGQAFLRELLATLDAMPVKELVARTLQDEQGAVCAIGSVMKARGIDTEKFDDYEFDEIAAAIGVASALVREVEYINDEAIWPRMKGKDEAKRRWQAVRDWVAGELKPKQSQTDSVPHG